MTIVSTEPTSPIRLAVVDDHPVLREGTAGLLARVDGFSVAWSAGSLGEAARMMDDDPVDVLVLDVRLGSESGLTLLSSPHRPAIVILTAYDYPQYVEAAYRMGAAGFVLKTAPTEELFEAIRRAAAGGMSFSRRPSASESERLSPREAAVVRLVVEGCSNDEIGMGLGITSKTVETHLRRIFERHGLRSRTELATRALREGWLEVPDDG